MNYDGPSFYKNKKIKNHREIEKEANEYITAPLNHSKKKAEKVVQEKRVAFRNRRIPDSLQNLAGWRKVDSEKELISNLEKRLDKDESDFLLLEGKIKDKLDEIDMGHDYRKKIEEKKLKNTHHAFKENVIKASKTTTGLHRSLSKIIAEDEEAMKNRKSNLGGLFTDKKDWKFIDFAASSFARNIWEMTESGYWRK